MLRWLFQDLNALLAPDSRSTTVLSGPGIICRRPYICRISTDRRSMMDCWYYPKPCIIVCQSAKKWAATCCRALNSTVLGPAVCTNLLLCRILLLLDVELQLQQSSRTSGVYSTEQAMKNSYSLTHLRSYVDCMYIASIFVNCSSIAPGQETMIWHDNVRFQCACGTVFVIFVLDYYIFLFLQLSRVGSVARSPWMICVLLASLIGPTLDRLHFFAGDIKIWLTDWLWGGSYVPQCAPAWPRHYYTGASRSREAVNT